VHEEARLTLELQRTFRIPDDGRKYPLPPGFGDFPMRHVDDFAARVPEAWIRHGGVMVPMYQSEALWIYFQANNPWDRDNAYPFAVLIGAGKINAVSGKRWTGDLSDSPQNYCAVPRQPWLDGYCVEKGVIRQFVSMPLGEGYTAEEQLTGEAEFGGLQILAFPMKGDVYDRRYPKINRRHPRFLENARCCMAMPSSPDMGLAPGGRMKQEIYEDEFPLSDYDTTAASRCFIHLANSLVWRTITGEAPPTVPITAKEYERAGLPWFDYYAADAKALEGSPALTGLQSVAEMSFKKATNPLPENESVTAEKVIHLRAGLKKGQVREGRF
jgi:hypothetical protein